MRNLLRLILVFPIVAACSRDRGAGPGPDVPVDLWSRLEDMAAPLRMYDGGDQDGCIGDSSQIYLAGAAPNEGAILYTFDPVALTFHKVGLLTGCPASVWSKGGFYPTAMALDRTTAWMNFWDGGQQVLRERLYKIDLDKATCTDTGADLTDAHLSFLVSGLASLPDKKNPAKDVLYSTVQYQDGVGMVTALATIDTTALKVTEVAATPAAAKLSDTGDGHLFAYMGGALVEMDPATAAVKSSKQLKLPIQSWPGMTLVFWQKQVWMFVAADSPLNATTHAYLIDPATGSATEKATLKDFYVAGSAVQPCVAIMPPG